MLLLNFLYFLEHESFMPAEFIAPRFLAGRFEYLIAISHRWSSPEEPDEGQLHFLEVRNRIHRLIDERSLSSEQIAGIAIFYDYSCIYQCVTQDFLVCPLHGRFVDYDKEQFVAFARESRQRDFEKLSTTFLLADEVYVTKYHNEDYYTRSWCLLEAFAGMLRGTLVDYVGPWPDPENWEFCRALREQVKTLTDRLGNDGPLTSVRDLVLRANCSLDSDKPHIAQCVVDVVEKLRMIRSGRTDSSFYRNLLAAGTLSERGAALRKAGLSTSPHIQP